MHIVFFSTSDVFRTEEILNTNGIGCKVVPTPVQDMAYCGVCIETSDTTAQALIQDMEFEVLD